MALEICEQDGCPSCRFCALRCGVGAQSTRDADSIVLAIVLSHAGDHKILLRPQWELLVATEDRGYFTSILEDFGQRLGKDPDELMDQLSSLNVGPLTTYQAGKSLAAYPHLLALLQTFQVWDASEVCPAGTFNGTVIEEVLTKAPSGVPMRDQDAYILSIRESRGSRQRAYLFSASHGRWSEIDQQIMFDDEVRERYADYQKTRKRYENYRASLIAQGYRHSDLER